MQLTNQMDTPLNYPTVVERYFTKYFRKGVDNEDVCILKHSNRICVVTLASNHPALKEGPVQKVSFSPQGKDFHLDNKIHGKKKAGAAKVSPSTVICSVTSGSGKEYLIKCGTRGCIMEMNEHLLTTPTLLNTMRETNGYIAVIYRNPQQEKQSFDSNDLLTEEQYNTLINEDAMKTENNEVSMKTENNEDSIPCDKKMEVT